MSELKNTVLRVLSHDITVTFSDPGMWSSGGMGRASLKDGEVVVANTMPVDPTWHTLIHELIHIGLDILSIEGDEQIIDGIAATMFSLLKDNPELVAKFQEQYGDD